MATTGRTAAEAQDSLPESSGHVLSTSLAPEATRTEHEATEDVAGGLPDAPAGMSGFDRLRARADPAMRARLLTELQATRGNRYVQRLVQRPSAPLTIQRQPSSTATPPAAPAAPAPQPAAAPPASPVAGAPTTLGTPTDPAADPSKQFLKAPPANGQPVVHVPSQVLLSESREHVRFQLESYFAYKGVDLLLRFDVSDSQFKLGYTGSQLDPTSQIPAPDSPEEAYRRRVVAVVRDEISTLRAQREIFLDYFQYRANEYTLNTMLDKSKEQVEKDRERYGATAKGWIFKDYSLNASADTAELADYAKKLLAKHQKIMEVSAALTPPRAELPAGGAPAGQDQEDYQRRQAAIDAQRAQVEPLEAEYLALRKEAEQKHPILAAYQLDIHAHDTPRHLAALASDTGEARAAHIVTEINEKLENIEKVRTKANQDKTRVWKLERVIGPTKNLPDVQARVPFSAGMRDAVVADKVLTEQLDEEFRAAAIGVIAFAVGLIAALPTGGASMAVTTGVGAAGVAGAAVDAALLAQAVKDYQFESAAAGSHYDKAQAISQDDPSLFWLAVQLVMSSIGASMAVSQARSMIAQVARLRTEALGLKAASMAAEAELANRLGAQYKQALGELETAGNEVNAGAGQRLRQEVENEPNPGRVRRTTGPESGGPATPAAEPPLPNAITRGPNGEPMNQVEAFSQYHRQIDANPNREYAVIRRGNSDQYALVIGEEQRVQIPLHLSEDWEFVTHYHPNFEWIDPRMKVIRESNFHARIPSTDDMIGAMNAATRQNSTPIMERLDWLDPSRNRTTMYRTTFGYNPGAEKPFWVQYPNEMGGMSPRLEFRTAGEYDAWFGALENAGPPTVRTPPPTH